MKGITEGKVELDAYFNKDNTKVICLEVNQDFVDILLGFLTLPLGRLVLHKQQHSEVKTLGSLSTLYDSMVKLDEKRFLNKSVRDNLVSPCNSSAALCMKLKLNINMDTEIPYHSGVFVKSGPNFLIYDDLKVETSLTSLEILKAHGHSDPFMVKRQPLSFGIEEFLKVLDLALLRNDPLSKMIIGGDMPDSSSAVEVIPAIHTESTDQHVLTITLIAHKVSGKVLYAEVGHGFVDLLFTFLVIPLGLFIHLTKDAASSSCLINLHKSASSLGDHNQLQGDRVKESLLRPKLHGHYSCVTSLLPIYDKPRSQRSFLKEPSENFVVYDDLCVVDMPSMKNLVNTCKNNGLMFEDMEAIKMPIGAREANFILKASLTSKTTLTDFLKTFRKDLKVN